MRAANSVMRWCTPQVRRSTTRTCLVACVVGDGEAETGPLSASWKLPAFLNARRDGAVLPILQLNGYKIAGPTVLGRSSDEDVAAYLSAQGWAPVFVEGDDPQAVIVDLHREIFAARARIGEIQQAARSGNAPEPGSVRWPAIVLRTPKGWTGPDVVDGVQVQGTFRAHQVPLAGVRENPDHLKLLEQWLQTYHPESLFDGDGALVEDLAAVPPTGDHRMSANPHANGGRLLRPLMVPAIERYACEVGTPAQDSHENTEPFGRLTARRLPRHHHRRRRRDVPAVLPRRDGEQPAAGGVRGHRPLPAGAGTADR